MKTYGSFQRTLSYSLILLCIYVSVRSQILDQFHRSWRLQQLLGGRCSIIKYKIEVRTLFCLLEHHIGSGKKRLERTLWLKDEDTTQYYSVKFLLQDLLTTLAYYITQQKKPFDIFQIFPKIFINPVTRCITYNNLIARFVFKKIQAKK